MTLSGLETLSALGFLRRRPTERRFTCTRRGAKRPHELVIQTTLSNNVHLEGAFDEQLYKHQCERQASVSMSKLLDQVRSVLRLKHYSGRTEETYTHWIVRYILYRNKHHPSIMNIAEIEQFLSYLATDR